MSLAIATVASDGVVLLSDSRVTGNLDGMNYSLDDIPKIITVGNHPVALVGSIEVIEEIVSRAASECKPFGGKTTFAKDREAIATRCRQLFTEKYGTHENGMNSIAHSTSATLVGHEKYGKEFGAFVYQLMPQSFFGARPKKFFAPSGQSIHGATYYLSRFYQPTMNCEQAAFLTYFCIREAIALDGSIGAPIRIWVVKNRKALEATQLWAEEFRERHASANQKMQSWFNPSGLN